MCGIVGYVGTREATGVLLDGLRRLEYRGYDSSGIAIAHGNGDVDLRRRVGKVDALAESLEREPIAGQVGIAHTRWATHGQPSEENAHPHTDSRGQLFLVHNGIIENYRELRQELEKAGCVFRSATDTEVAAQLIGHYYQGDAVAAVRQAIPRLRGSFAFAIVFRDHPDQLLVVRNRSPLILGLGNGENFIGSDPQALLSYTRRVLFLDDEEMALVTAAGVKVWDLAGHERTKQPVELSYEAAAAELGSYPHFMLKEIHEQPQVIRELLQRYVAPDGTRVNFPELGLGPRELVDVRRIFIQACGTSWHAGLIGKMLIERLARIPVDTDISSEFRYSDTVLEPNTLVIGISQSGETADTLAGIVEAKERGLKVISLCNVEGSSVARESDGVIYTAAGPEIGVASTKAYTAQIACLYLLALHLGQVRWFVDQERLARRLARLATVPDVMEGTLRDDSAIVACAQQYGSATNFMFIGRGFGYPSALEGALKLKEISYIHAEAYPAGELKHGPIALIDERMPVVAICTNGATYEKMVSNVEEVRARRGPVIAICSDGNDHLDHFAQHVIRVPEITESFTPFVVSIPLQLLAYYMAVHRGCDVDKPRNLAKSVTVE
jgi:glucosamine--fructose-6-phosphate aminotransferase (isomerizing)